MLRGVEAAHNRAMTTAWIVHIEGAPASSARSRGGRFQDFLANVVGEQGEERSRRLGCAPLLRESREATGGSIIECTRRLEQNWQQDMDPLIGFALPHAEQSPLNHLQGVGFQVNEQEE